MDAQELRNLQEAYLEVVIGEGKVEWDNPKRHLPSGLTPREKNRAKRISTGVENPNIKPSEKKLERYGKLKIAHDDEKGKKVPRNKRHHFSQFDTGPFVSDPVSKRREQKNKLKDLKELVKEDFDLYDIILSHLLDEGYADTEQAAEAIMVNMSEEWKEEILDEAIASEKDKEGAAEMTEADSIAAMRERAAKRRKQRYGASDTSRGGRDDFAPITDYAAADKKWARPHVQKESFNVFVNSMIGEGISMESYTWKEIQNVFDDIFEAQVANRNPDEYERKAKQGQSREQQLKGKVMGRMSQMDPEKRKKMLAQMRAVGLDV